MRVDLEVSFVEIVLVFSVVLKRVVVFEYYIIEKEVLSMWEWMFMILSMVNWDVFMFLDMLFSIDEGKVGVVVFFFVILELVKE